MKETFSSEYERCDLRANSTKKGIIPVSATRMTEESTGVTEESVGGWFR
ncbi:hypothetical protein HC358_02860 [Wolbachia pipientis]|uniref:Uncharacterized protein n=1 Tax=Wolbachia pipientis TaxID=955 RepID=A0A7G5C9Z1_WOLPI|nr:hypothetical protein [Wolbachia pipientis]QMV46025.1 hypothetical protein HC358_02860 [Wolbachia pipientis]